MTMIHDRQNLGSDEWRPCGGEVHGLVRRLRWRRHGHHARRFMALVIIALAPVSICFSSSVKSYVTSQIELKVAPKPCDYYEDEMRAYYCEKSRSDLPPDLWVHLSHCRDCSRDLVFYGGIAQCLPDGRRHRQSVKQSAHLHHGPEQAVSLMQVLAKGTLAVQQ
jgi:hypothetical protein